MYQNIVHLLHHHISHIHRWDCGDNQHLQGRKPSTYDKSVITVKEGEGEASIHNNLLKLIYDSMHENVASQVLEQILYKYSETIYGVFNKVIADKEKTSSEAEP